MIKIKLLRDYVALFLPDESELQFLSCILQICAEERGIQYKVMGDGWEN